jgi:hypothetical protein
MSFVGIASVVVVNVVGRQPEINPFMTYGHERLN